MKKGKTWGDTHLWQIWHGMRPIEAFREFPTRFCSEYGMESMPSMHTVRSFTASGSPGLFDPEMQLHQKSSGGNEKILYYLLAKYRKPVDFEDYIYLSQLVQAGTIRFATDCWRRNIGRQNGAIFWQMNDCWPVASWAGIDYHKQLKAVMYQARHFNKMLCLSNDYFDDRAELYVTNEYPSGFSGRLEWSLEDFYGNIINNGTEEVSIGAVASVRVAVLSFKDMLRGKKASEAVLIVRLMENGETRDEKQWLLVPDKNAALPKAALKSSCRVEGNTATVEIAAASYARYVYLEASGVTAPWSDNFFDVPARQSRSVSVELPEGMDAAELQRRLKIKSLSDVVPENTLVKDQLLRAQMVLRNKNYLSWLSFRLFLG
jgi:beta-mannosidase